MTLLQSWLKVDTAAVFPFCPLPYYTILLFLLQTTSGIPDLPDITHPDELKRLGTQVLQVFQILTVLIGGFGVILAMLSFSVQRQQDLPANFVTDWMTPYSRLLRGLQHTALILVLVVGGFYLCSTLANRYHHWEQARIQSGS
jgi:hypothetical protein